MKLKMRLINRDDPVFLTILICILLVVGCGSLINYYFEKAHDDEKQALEDQVDTLEGQVRIINAQKDSITSSLNDEMKTYEDKSLGFNFNYPEAVQLDNQFSKTQGITMGVTVEKINEIGSAPNGMGGDTALEDQEALTHGDPSILIGWPVDGSMKLLTIKGALGKEFTTLQQFSCDDIEFNRTAVIYKGGYRVRITVTNHDVDKIVEKNPQFFVYNKDCAGDTKIKIWKSASDFYQALIKGQSDNLSQEWFSVLDKIISSFKFDE